MMSENNEGKKEEVLKKVKVKSVLKRKKSERRENVKE